MRLGNHERGLADRGVRKSMGAYYTPPDVVERMLDLTLDPILRARTPGGVDALASIRVIDPACGTGNFLAAAAGRIAAALVEAGAAPPAAASAAVRCVHGVDIDPTALRLCRSALASVGAGEHGQQILVGDSLLDPGLAREGSFDLVIGNPPFLSQLGTDTARGASDQGALRDRFGPAIASYTDPAAAFLVLAMRLARPDGGVAALIEPVSFLTAQGAAGARRAVLQAGALTDLWVLGDRVFDAAVEVCAPVLVRGRQPSSTQLHRGRSCQRHVQGDAPQGHEASWSGLLADLGGLPRRVLHTAGHLGDLAAATADFRDQYYGLAPHVVDQPDGDDAAQPPLVTSGLIDPGHLAWGTRRTRFNKVGFGHPRVELAGLDPRLGAWAASRLVPKVLLATQTKVLEALVDERGRLLPSVPVITITPTSTDPLDPLDLWRIAAVLTCPAVSLEAARRHLGSGRNARAMRLRAAEVLALPLPAGRASWDQAAELLRAGAPLVEVGSTMDEAYGLVGDGELLEWWVGRLPEAAASSRR